MKEFCVDLEIAKELDNNINSEFFYVYDDSFYFYHKGEFFTIEHERGECRTIDNLKYLNAPSSDEILRELPNFIQIDDRVYYLNIFRDTYTAVFGEYSENYYEVSYTTHDGKCLNSPNNICTEADNLSDALAKMFLYLKKEGHIKCKNIRNQ